MIEQTLFLSTVFLCSELKLEYIYSGANFCGKNACGNFFFCGSLEKAQKLEPTKISCHTVWLVYLVNFVCFVDSLSLFLRKAIKKNRPVRRGKASADLKFSLIACNTIELS